MVKLIFRKRFVYLDSQESAENLLLRQQIDMLKSQLSDARDRESFYQNQIETMQRLLEAPKPSRDPDQSEDNDTATTPQQEVIEEKNARYPVPEIKEEIPPKRGFLSRFFLPNG